MSLLLQSSLLLGSGGGSGPVSVDDLTDISESGAAVAKGTPAEARAAILDGATITASVKLADTSASTEEAGVLGLNSSGQVVVHTNESDGDSLPPLLDSTSMEVFQGIITADEINAVSGTTAMVQKLLCAIPLSSEQMSVGRRLLVSGRAFMAFGGTPKPAFAALVATLEGQVIDLDQGGISLQVGEGISSEMIEFSLMVDLADDSPNFVSTMASNGPPAYFIRNSSGTVTHAVGAAPSGVLAGLPGQPNTLSLYLVTFDDSGTEGETLYITGQISVRQVA